MARLRATGRKDVANREQSVEKRFDSLPGERGGDGGFKGEKEEEEEVSGCRGITRSANEMRSFRELFGQGRRTVTII